MSIGGKLRAPKDKSGFRVGLNLAASVESQTENAARARGGTTEEQQGFTVGGDGQRCGGAIVIVVTEENLFGAAAVCQLFTERKTGYASAIKHRTVVGHPERHTRATGKRQTHEGVSSEVVDPKILRTAVEDE